MAIRLKLSTGVRLSWRGPRLTLAHLLEPALAPPAGPRAGGAEIGVTADTRGMGQGAGAAAASAAVPASPTPA